VFQSKANGGKLPWRTVIEDYTPIALDVENRWANTKFLLSQFIPGRDVCYLLAARSKSFEQLVTAIGMERLTQQARELDESCGFGPSEEADGRKRQAKEPSQESSYKKAKVEDDQSFSAAAALRSAVSV